MLLQELRRLAAELEEELPREGYARRRVRYLVQLDLNGRFLGLVDLAESPKAPGKWGTQQEIPDAGSGRTSGIRPALLVDRPDYVFGLSASGKETRVTAARAAFLELVAECAQATELTEVGAVERYLRSGHIPDELEPDGGLVSFAVGETRPADLAEVSRFWARKLRGEPAGPELECLVCGKVGAPADPWPVTIKGLPGVVSSQLVSANAPAFESYGLTGSATSPACFDCALQVGQALNWLLAREAHHLRTLEASVFVFWSRGGNGFDIGRLLSSPEPDEVRELLETPRTGRRGSLELEAERFYAAELSPNRTRIVLRSWIDASLDEVRQHLRDYFAGQAMVQPDGAPVRPIPLWRLAMATTRGGRDRAGLHPALVQDLLATALSGTALPWRVAAAVLRRLHADRGGISQPQAALLKLALRPAHSPQEVFMQLDLSDRSPGYLCGRLLAELEAIQRAALGNPKASLTDRYFGAASSAPATVFGQLLRMATQAHLPKLRRDKRGAYVRLDRQLQDIMAGLPGFPATLTLREQALFALGFYHQKAADRQAVEAAKAAKATVAAELAAIVDTDEEETDQ